MIILPKGCRPGCCMSTWGHSQWSLGHPHCLPGDMCGRLGVHHLSPGQTWAPHELPLGLVFWPHGPCPWQKNPTVFPWSFWGQAYHGVMWVHTPCCQGSLPGLWKQVLSVGQGGRARLGKCCFCDFHIGPPLCPLSPWDLLMPPPHISSPQLWQGERQPQSQLEGAEGCVAGAGGHLPLQC